MTAFIENGLDVKRLPLLETLMSIGNGYMGTRAYLEEFNYEGSIRGNYINGIYERIPMEHAEWAWGFPEQSDRMPNLIDLFQITIFLDGEEVVLDGNILEFKRELDYKSGLLKRSYKYKTKEGLIAKINFEHLISFSRIFLKNWTLNIDYEGDIKVMNHIDFNITNMVNEEDPRTASKHVPLVKVKNSKYNLNHGEIYLETYISEIQIKMDFIDSGNFNYLQELNEEYLNIDFLSKGNLRINRMVKYWDSIRAEKTDFVEKSILYEEQIDYIKTYENNTNICLKNNHELNNAITFIRFHILQSTTRDMYGNIAAKGLSGEGYEGHYFWDTEIFLFPVWLLWDKDRAKNLLLYRHNLLDIARARALELGHRKGACFSWRTISGIESSGYFPAGSAQFHINFDIAYTFIQYWLATKDRDFLIEYSIELLMETARTVLEIGNLESDGFHIHTVTGPDEYTALVSNNYYTNKMAQYNLIWAVKLWNMLKNENYEDWLTIKEKLKIEDWEISNMIEAGDKMIFIYDEDKQIIAQDSTFLSKANWPIENKLRPLLLNYHPLTIYRHQVLKQADTVLAQYLLNDVEEDIIKNSFYYYENISTHDSSLSPCISGLMASRIGDLELSYKYFMDSVFMDIKDLHHNTTDGLHMANLGGSILSVIKGFGGIKIEEDGLHVYPSVPEEIGKLKFRLTWRNTLLEFQMDHKNIEVEKISGPSTSLIIKGNKTIIGERAVLFDLDGVLTGTSDNHYKAWKKLSKELGYDLPEEFRGKLRGISRIESINKILDFFNLDYSEEEKLELTNRKNKYYKESISHFDERNLYPGVIELLKTLKDKGVKIGLVSASNNAPNLIKNMGIGKYFDVIVNPKSVKRGKPYPDPFLEAAKMLNVDPVDCLGVEDAKAGIESINAAGMTSVGIGDEELNEADISFSKIKEASDFIKNWVVKNSGRD
ncbi:MAG: beta-phosphoglucomutase [Tissierellia bacterium]|nr:beta-phosphoglucomutase [Tissierellia bacterium]